MVLRGELSLELFRIVVNLLLGFSWVILSEDEGIHYVCLVADNRVNRASDVETHSSTNGKGNKNKLEDGEENEHEQNDYENGIEDDVVLYYDQQNVTNSENTGNNKKKKNKNNNK